MSDNKKGPPPPPPPTRLIVNHKPQKQNPAPKGK